MPDCPFCARIAAGEYDDDLKRFDAVSFEPLNPVTEGHWLVVPRIHVSSAFTAPAITADVLERVAGLDEEPDDVTDLVKVEVDPQLTEEPLF